MGHGLSDIISAETDSGDGSARDLRQPAHPAATGGEGSGAETGGEEEGLGGMAGREGEAVEGGSLDPKDQGLQGAPEGGLHGNLICHTTFSNSTNLYQ